MTTPYTPDPAGVKPRRTRVSAYALLHENDRILLCRLSEAATGWQGFWTLPGGGLEFGESPEEALVREVEEETGLKIKVGAIAAVDSLLDTTGPEEVHAIRIIYNATRTGGELHHEIGGTSDLCVWHELEAAPVLMLVPLAARGIEIAGRRSGSGAS